jgi:5'-nucleotidase
MQWQAIVRQLKAELLLTAAPRLAALRKTKLYLFCLICALPNLNAAQAAPVPVTILHTNDLHSHFRPERTALALGGLGRLATAVRKFRAENPNTLVVDGGDWSEGTIYYTEGTGRESLRLMDSIGYDVAVVGNHDWINGPDLLLNAIQDAQNRFGMKLSVIGANIYAEKYNRGDEFHRYVPPYAIRTVGGVRIAFIGLITYEFIYDHFFTPLYPTEPFEITRKLVARLKPQVDAIVLVSHNNTKINEDLLRAVPEVDLVIGAHDHVLYREPQVVQRTGKSDGWVVETGSNGRYLGEVNLLVTPKSEVVGNSDPVQLLGYRLHQMDSRYPEDPVISAQVSSIETLISSHFGPVFDDHLAENQLELNREVLLESGIGDFVTDAYLNATHADLSLDQNRFIYGELHPGDLHTVDIFNVVPNVYNPVDRRCWTLKVLPMKGRTLLSIMNILYSYGKITQLGSLSTAGMQVVFNHSVFPGSQIKPVPRILANFPLIESGRSWTPNAMAPLLEIANHGEHNDTGFIHSAVIQGAPLDPNKTYRVALGGGIIEAFTFLNSILPNFVPMEGIHDTGRESWRVLADYVRSLGVINESKISIGGRIRSLQPNLGVAYNDVRWLPIFSNSRGTMAKIQVKIRNYGEETSKAQAGRGFATVQLLLNANGSDYGPTPIYEPAAEPRRIPPLARDESVTLEWDNVFLPIHQGLHNLRVEIQNTDDEVDHTNDQVIRWFVPSQAATSAYDPRIDLIQ